MTAAEISAALTALGYSGAGEAPVRKFQADHGLRVDGDPGPITQKALGIALAALALTQQPAFGTGTSVVPLDWMPACRMDRIVVHWSAGGHAVSGLDKQHYHVIVDGDGNLVRGLRTIKQNAAPITGAYAAHTLNCNSGSIGVSLACMAGAVESPFKAGSAPMTLKQWDMLPAVLADLCRRYLIAVAPRTVLSHAEVQPTLGITQRGKWDIAAIPGPGGRMTKIGARPAGDILRARTAELLKAA